MIGRRCLYVLRKNPLKASALNEDKPKAPDEFSTATPEAERERVLPKNIWVRLPPAGSASLLPVCWRIHNAKNRKDSSFRFLTATRGIEPLFSP